MSGGPSMVAFQDKMSDGEGWAEHPSRRGQKGLLCGKLDQRCYGWSSFRHRTLYTACQYLGQRKTYSGLGACSVMILQNLQDVGCFWANKNRGELVESE
jgi:hypothetical protein